MNLIEFMAAADELFYERQIELWVVGNVADRLQDKNHCRATRFLGFVEDLEPIFRSVRSRFSVALELVLSPSGPAVGSS
jgi:hypothetical protein